VRQSCVAGHVLPVRDEHQWQAGLSNRRENVGRQTVQIGGSQGYVKIGAAGALGERRAVQAALGHHQAVAWEALQQPPLALGVAHRQQDPNRRPVVAGR
jgi:hypothetical protein